MSKYIRYAYLEIGVMKFDNCIYIYEQEKL